MLRNRYALGLLVFLLLANIIYYLFSGWGLITVKVHEVSLSKVISSIEWQGWVKIYTNIPGDTKISMYVDHVPLAEAMETLAANSGAQWKLGFFAAPTGAEVKDEIISFEKGTARDTKTYTYPTMLQMAASADSDDGLPAADPRLQVWPGKPVDDTTISGYLDAMAKAANIWIMAPSSWDAKVSGAPSANNSIAKAVKDVVGRARGSVTTALVLQQRARGNGGGGGRGFGGGSNDWESMDERIRNAINGLPEDARAGALAQMDQETKFHADLQAAPEDQRREMMRQHMAGKMNGGNLWRMSPEKRAQMYQRMVAMRLAAKAGQ